MSPIVSTLAGAAARGYGGLGAFAPSGGAYDSIATTTLSTATASITFSSIPATYTHLQLRYIARDTLGAADVTGLLLRFNSDSGTNYTRHYLLADGSGVYVGAGTSRTSINGGLVLSGGGPASVFAAGVIDILDYANTNKYKTYRVLDGVDTNATLTTGYVDFESALWLSTSAVTSITITLPSGTFAQYTQVALYGVKGA